MNQHGISMKLADIRLRSIMRFDPINNTFEQSRSLKYLRQPRDSEYPLNLERGYAEYVHREGVFPRPFEVVQHYLMRVEPTKQMLQETDFILNRTTLLIFLKAKPVDPYTKEYRFEAFRFKGCIFIRHFNDEEIKGMRDSYAFKARQYLLTERLGEAPDTDSPIDERMQQYGVFSARLGQFRLLYTAELTGLSNTEPLGDLTDQQELDKCRLTAIKVCKQQINWKNNFRCYSWASQAYLSGIDKLVVASFDDNGQVVRPVKIESMETLLQSPRVGIGCRVQRMHQFLERISVELTGVDSPSASVKFQLIGETLVFEKAFDVEFIDYLNQL